MTVSGDGGLAYRRLRAPSGHGEKLIAPPIDTARGLLLTAQHLQSSFDCSGRSIRDLAAEAQQALLASATAYTHRATAAPSLEHNAPLILTGHQPHLFHPGVWFKNSVINYLAKSTGGHSINLIIDNDLARESAIRVPHGSTSEPRIQSLAYDRADRQLPYEERQIYDLNLFRSFGTRASKSIRALGFEPVLAQFWAAAIGAVGTYATLGECLSAARRELEQEWGFTNLELPLSDVCEQPPFRWFAAHLLERLPELQHVYNSALATYRKANRIRSRTHPVPELQADGEFLEAPYWVWTDEDPMRRPLFVKQRKGNWRLTDRRLLSWEIDAGSEGCVQKVVEQLTERHNNIKLRPRALLTTMYARLFLSHLFVHGIGGAKYDELTDLIIRRLFSVNPPNYVVATATLRLPIRLQQHDPAKLSDVHQQLRQTVFQPERFVRDIPEASELVEQKAHWVQVVLPRGQRKPRHDEIVRINGALQPFVEAQRARLIAARDRLLHAEREQRTFGSREFAFCLFPETSLRSLLLDF